MGDEEPDTPSAAQDDRPPTTRSVRRGEAIAGGGVAPRRVRHNAGEDGADTFTENRTDEDEDNER